MLKPTAEQIDAVLGHPTALFMLPELTPLAEALAAARTELAAALGASECGSCRSTAEARFGLWYQQQWYPKFVEALNSSDCLLSVFVNILQASETCPV